MLPNIIADLRADFDSLAVFSDFDGTLVDLAPTPDSIVVPPGLGATLAGLAGRLDRAVAIVSGRPIAELDGYLAPARLPAAGAHGAERRRADGGYEGPPAEIADAVAGIAGALAPLVAGRPGLLLEPKPGAVALHYRQAPELEALCRDAMAAAVAGNPGFTVMAGKMVVEARPAAISKGEAVRRFMAEAPFAGRRPVFIGDDTTDEDGFAAVQQLGGTGVKVGAGDSAAQLRLADTAAVRQLIGDLADAAAGAPGRAAR